MSGRRRSRVASGVAAVAVVVAAVVLALAVRGAGAASPGSELIGRPAPALHGTTLAGGTFDLRSLRGKEVLVNVWASWCAPCRQELPTIDAAARRWAASGLRVVTINTRDGTTTATSFLKRTHATNLLTVSDPDGRLAVAWGITGIPETFLVDPSGVVRAHWAGPVTWQWLRSEVPQWAT